MPTVNIGGKLYDSNQKFEYDTGFGHAMSITAAKAAHIVGTQGMKRDSLGWSNYESGISMVGDYIDPNKKKEAPKAAPRPSGGGGGGGGKPKASSGGGGGATQNDLVNKLFDKIDQLMGKKANEAIKGDPYGIEDTKLNHLAPETVRRSFLTNSNEARSYSSNMVVDPATGKAFNSAKDAQDAGITNWVYKFQYDKKMQPDQNISLTGTQTGLAINPTEGLGGAESAPATGAPQTSAQSVASNGYRWRNRNTTNQWYSY